MSFTVQVLTADDVELMRAMLRLFGEVFDEVPTYVDAMPDDDYLRGLLQRDTFIAVAALQGGEVDDSAIALYSKLGRREAVLHFDLPVLQRK